MTTRQYVGYGILIALVGGIGVLVIVAAVHAIVAASIPWEVWVFVPLLSFAFCLLGYALYRDWRRESAVRTVVQLRRDVDRLDEQLPDLSFLRSQVDGLGKTVQSLRESDHRRTVLSILDRVSVERGWTVADPISSVDRVVASSCSGSASSSMRTGMTMVPIVLSSALRMALPTA